MIYQELDLLFKHGEIHQEFRAVHHPLQVEVIFSTKQGHRVKVNHFIGHPVYFIAKGFVVRHPQSLPGKKQNYRTISNYKHAEISHL